MTAPHAQGWTIGARVAEFSRVAPVLAMVIVGTAIWAFVIDFDSWRRDTMQAADNAGIYLFISSPVLAAATAWGVTRATMSLGELAGGAVERDLLWRAGWLPFALLSAGMHVLVIVTMVLVARLSDAVGSLDALPILVQFLSIFFFAAAGAFLGDRFRSTLTAPVVALALLALNTVLASSGFRKITEVGTGSADFIDLHLRLPYLLPKVAIFGAFVIFALPIRRLPITLDIARRYLAPTVAAAVAVFVMASDEQPQAYAAGPRACHQVADVTACAPRELSGHTALQDAAVLKVRHLLGQLSVDGVPRRVDYVSRGAINLPQGSVSITVTAEALSSARLATREVELGFSYAMSCLDPRAELGPSDSVIRAQALLDGWLQHQLGTIEPGSYPTDGWRKLNALPLRTQVATLRRMFEEVWKCEDEVRGVP